MKKLIFASILMLTLDANAQVFDLVRSFVIRPSPLGEGLYTEDSAHPGIFEFSQTGFMEINGNQVNREFHLCINKVCQDFKYRDKILYADSKIAGLSGDSGDVSTLNVISLSPTIIVMRVDGNYVFIEEYKPR